MVDIQIIIQNYKFVVVEAKFMNCKQLHKWTFKCNSRHQYFNAIQSQDIKTNQGT